MDTSNKMQAVVCHAPNKYNLEFVDIPKPGPGELLVKVDACGICASDCKASGGAEMFWGGDNPWLKAPVIPGHEFYGHVVAFGEGASEKYSNLKINDRVTADQIIPCWNCRYCNTGKYWMCEVHNIFGFQKNVAEGAMAEYMIFPKNSIVHKIPEQLSVAECTMLEPMACAIHTVNRGDIQLDDVVVIAGAGPLGLCMVQIAHLKTPKKLIVIDQVEERLTLAKQYGADVVLNFTKTNVEQYIKELTGGYGCDVYIETTGSPAGVKQGLNLTRKLGRFVEFSVFGEETSADWSIIGDRKELDIRGAHLGPYCYPIAIDLFERKLISAKEMVTHEYPLDSWQEALTMAKSDQSIKVILVP